MAVAAREPGLARRVGRRTGLMIADLGPMGAARRAALLALQVKDRRSGYPAETLGTRLPCGLANRGGGVDYLQRRGRSLY
jgi:hypothetical protein